MEQFLEVGKNIIAILGFFGVTIVVEKLPIKLSPYTWIKNFLIKDIVETQKNILERVGTLEEKVDTNELDRIRQEIMAFSQSLKIKDYPVCLRDFEHISEIYKKYHSMGGNGLITEEMNFIKSKYNEFRGNE